MLNDKISNCHLDLIGFNFLNRWEFHKFVCEIESRKAVLGGLCISIKNFSDKANGDIYAEEKSALPSDSELELTLTLDKVTTDQDGQRLICEASTSYPPEQSTARQYTEISVSCK
ncbi:hypothetical protein ACTXT7_006638 [Hymenolepis weldensis]